MNVNEDTKALIELRSQTIKTGKAKAYLQRDPSFPDQQKAISKISIEREIKNYEHFLERIEVIAKELKARIGHITDRSLICASYLILGKIINTFKAIFILSRSGFNHEVMELTRSIMESNELISLFHLKKEEPHLSKWFDGEIIDNGISRDAMSSLMSTGEVLEYLKKNNLDPKKMMSGIYRVMSKYSHCSYAAILDSVDVFNEDFDFHQYAGFHFTESNTHMTKTALSGTLTAIRIIYLELQDQKGSEKVKSLQEELFGESTGERYKRLIINGM